MKSDRAKGTPASSPPSKERGFCGQAFGEQFSQVSGRSSQPGMNSASTYSAHIQKAMRYDRLSSADYSLVMTILHAVSQGYTEEQWQDEQQRSVQLLRQQSPEKGCSHADAADRYEQTVKCLQDLLLWPW